MAFAGSSYLRLSTRLIPLLLAAACLHFPLTDGQLGISYNRCTVDPLCYTVSRFIIL
jgi:hypothetical protein